VLVVLEFDDYAGAYEFDPVDEANEPAYLVVAAYQFT